MRLPHYSAVPRTFPFSNVPSRPFSNTKTLLVSLVPESSPIFPCHSSNHRSKTRTLSPTERPLEPNLENPGQDSLQWFRLRTPDTPDFVLNRSSHPLFLTTSFSHQPP